MMTKTCKILNINLMVRGVKNLFLKKEQGEILDKFFSLYRNFGYSLFFPGILSEKDKFLEFSNQKQIYNLTDKSNRELVLSPEHTANLFSELENNPRIYYFSPCFRYERPQKSRYRQFHQLGIETLYNIEEVVLLAKEFLSNFEYKLVVNSIGTKEERKKSINYDSFSQETQREFKDFLKFLEKNNIEYIWDKNLKRGLDYYENIVFEFQATNGVIFGGGGKYSFNNKIACGLAFGLERMTENLNFKKKNTILLVLKSDFNSNTIDICKHFFKYNVLFASRKKIPKEQKYVVYIQKDKLIFRYIEENLEKYDVFSFSEISKLLSVLEKC